jgi:hypothetical protein
MTISLLLDNAEPKLLQSSEQDICQVYKPATNGAMKDIGQPYPLTLP